MVTMKEDRLLGLSDPSRGPYQTVISYLKQRQLQRKADKARNVQIVKLPHRVTGQELRQLEGEFGWKLEVVDRAPARAPYAEAKYFCLALVNKNMKSWDGEEVVVFDSDFMTLVVKNEGWVHCCCTYATSAKAAGYELQVMALTKATEGKRPDIAWSASEFRSQFLEGRGKRVCAEASKCEHVADTLLVDLPRVDVGAEQLARALLQHQASRAKVWFFFEPDMFLEDVGPLTSMPGKYLIDRRADRVYIFPDGSTTSAFDYSFSSMMSYVLQSDVSVDGDRFVMEVHDSMPGVKFVHMVKAVFNVPCDSEFDVHYFKESGEPLSVVEQKWFPPAMDGVGLDGRQIAGRFVMPTKTIEKVVGRVLSAAEKKITVELARGAARDVVGQDVVKGTVVFKPRTYPADVMEQLAQYALKRAVKERAEMVMEQRSMGVRVRNARGDSGSWVNNVLGAFFSCGDIVKAVTELPAKMLEGFTVSNDYTFKMYPLDPAFVVRNVVRATTGDSFGSRLVNFFPGGKGGGGAPSSTSSVDLILLRARAARTAKLIDESDAVALEEETVRENEGTDGFPSMSKDRDALVEKMTSLYDAHDARVGYREEVALKVCEPPITSQTAMVADPVTAIMDDYRRMFPALDDTDLSIRTHLASTSDREENSTAALRVLNREYDNMARDQRVRKSKLATAGGGARVVTQTEAVLCFDKRVNNAPRCQWPTDMHNEARKQVENFANTCFKPGWRNVVEQRLSDGLWSSRVNELGKNVRKADQDKVSKMLQESFSVGTIDMTKWKAIVKSVAKPKVSESAAFEHSVSQTILFQECKLENSYFSSQLTEFHDTLDEVLIPNVRMNIRRDVDDMEKWFNSFNARRETLGKRCKSYEVDITQCDKSHTLFNWLVWLEFLRLFSLPDELYELWAVMMGKKTASAPMVGMLVEFFEQLTSGGFHTISFNSIVCGVGVVNAMGLTTNDIVTVQIVGDDSLVETMRLVDETETVEHLQNMYNLEAKMICSEVRYFCSRFYVLVDGWWHLMRDPGKLAEATGRHISAIADLGELHQAYCDSSKNYDKEECVQVLPYLFAHRMQLSFAPIGMCRGLASLRDRDNFFDSFESQFVTLAS